MISLTLAPILTNKNFNLHTKNLRLKHAIITIETLTILKHQEEKKTKTNTEDKQKYCQEKRRKENTDKIWTAD